MMRTIFLKNLTDKNFLHGWRNFIHWWKYHLWMSSMDGEGSSLDVIHGWRNVIHWWKNVIHGWHPWMETPDDGYVRSKHGRQKELGMKSSLFCDYSNTGKKLHCFWMLLKKCYCLIFHEFSNVVVGGKTDNNHFTKKQSWWSQKILDSIGC